MKYIDLTYINEVTGGDEELFKELSGIFLSQVEEMKTVIYEALRSSDYELIKQAAHKIKSSLRTFGAYALAGQFEEIENYQNLEIFENLEEHIERLLSQVDMASIELKHYMEETNKSMG